MNTKQQCTIARAIHERIKYLDARVVRWQDGCFTKGTGLDVADMDEIITLRECAYDLGVMDMLLGMEQHQQQTEEENV